MILRLVGYICAGAVSFAAYYWIFDKFEYLFNKIIPAVSPRVRRARDRRLLVSRVKQFPRDNGVPSPRLSIRVRAFTFFRV